MNRLKELRENSNLTQIQIARKLNLTQRNYSYLETGKTALTSEILNRLADLYHTSTDYILYRTDTRNAYPKSIVDKTLIEI